MMDVRQKKKKKIHAVQYSMTSRSKDILCALQIQRLSNTPRVAQFITSLMCFFSCGLEIFSQSKLEVLRNPTCDR